MITETDFSLICRPVYQQWLVFCLLSIGMGILAIFVLILPEWRRWQSSEQHYLQQLTHVKKEQKQVALLLPPEQLHFLGLLASQTQQQVVDMSPEQLLAASPVTVTRWMNTGQPAELALELQWPEAVDLFQQMVRLNPPFFPDRFTLQRRQDRPEALEMMLWLNRYE